jgi:hypothetical protein
VKRLLLIVCCWRAGRCTPASPTRWSNGRSKGALVESGIGEKRAACMAERMVDRLTMMQLWKLRQGMAAQDRASLRKAMASANWSSACDRVDDGEAVAVLTTSAGLCALGIGCAA